MRMLLVLVLVAVTACGGGTQEDAASTTSLPATTTAAIDTTTPSTVPDTTTTSTTVEADWPDYYVFGMDGLAMAGDGRERQLVDMPVWNAASDFRGGVVFESVDPEGSTEVYWLEAGVDDPIEIEAIVRPLDAMTTLVDGRPVLVGTEPVGSDDIEQALEIVSFDLATEQVTAYPVGFGFEGDAGGTRPSSVGDHLVVGTSFATVGTLGTSKMIMFWDLETAHELTDLPNPLTDTCEPCELGVRLSPDGGRLAYWHRPDAKWPEDWADAGEMDSVPWEEWWADSSEIPGIVVVLDLQTGARVFEAEERAGWRLGGFDGRHVVLHTFGPNEVEASKIIDTQDGAQLSVEGYVALEMTASGE